MLPAGTRSANLRVSTVAGRGTLFDVGEGQRLAVDSADLHAAAGVLGAARGELGCGVAVSPAGALGTGALGAALDVLGARLDFLASAIGEAVGDTERKVGAGAELYVHTDAHSMPGAVAGG